MLTREIATADRWRTSLVAAPIGAEYAAKVALPFNTASTGASTLGVSNGKNMLGIDPSDAMITGSLPSAGASDPESLVNRQVKAICR